MARRAMDGGGLSLNWRGETARTITFAKAAFLGAVTFDILAQKTLTVTNDARVQRSTVVRPWPARGRTAC